MSATDTCFISVPGRMCAITQGVVLIEIPKGLVVWTRQQVIEALKAGKRWRRLIASLELTRNTGHESLTEVFGRLCLIPRLAHIHCHGAHMICNELVAGAPHIIRRVFQ
jgi:hypothetical protein